MARPPITVPNAYVDKNNLIAPNSATIAWAKSLLAIDRTGVRVDVTTDVPRTALGVETSDLAFTNVLGLISADADPAAPLITDIPFSVAWFAPGSPLDPVIKVIEVYNYVTRVYLLETEGMGSEANVRKDETFSIMLSGSEGRAYRNYKEGDIPLAIITLTPAMFPLRIYAGASGGSDMLNIMIRGLTATTTYASRQQVADFGSVQSRIRVKVYQKSRYEGLTGFVTDYTTPVDIRISEAGDTRITEAGDTRITE